MVLTNDEKRYLAMVVKREWKHLASERGLREPDSDLSFLLTQKKYEQFVKNLLKKLT
ncbi:hypothetical protein HY492_02530 [Candidatus Woesearchaeota archaeon]|nr:hypothetical protein [Candidatus Woesearchaeota archaeon]